MIVRVWHGWASKENAEAYESLVRGEVLPSIAAMKITGYQGFQLLRRELDQEIEFVTILKFNSLEDVRAFVGEDYQQAHVPPAARALLSRFDEQSAHYELRDGD